MPQGQPIGGEDGRDFLLAWRAKAQILLYQAPSRDEIIVSALKKEYQDFYQSIGFSQTAEDAKNAFVAGANPNKKRKLSGKFFVIL
jgi:hypothetical protein